MSLDFYLEVMKPTEIFSANITHNLTRMASEAGVYIALWHPERIPANSAADLIEPLTAGLALLKSDPARFEKHNAPNGWGKYENFVPFVERCLKACIENPGATVRVWI